MPVSVGLLYFKPSCDILNKAAEVHLCILLLPSSGLLPIMASKVVNTGVKLGHIP